MQRAVQPWLPSRTKSVNNSELYPQAAKQGVSKAQSNLVANYIGLGVAENPALAVVWWQTAVE